MKAGIELLAVFLPSMAEAEIEHEPPSTRSLAHSLAGTEIVTGAKNPSRQEAFELPKNIPYIYLYIMYLHL
jgi:hypothetical protein